MKFLYQLFILLYPLAAKLIAPFNSKAMLWVLGRKNLLDELSSVFLNETRPVIWIHCSSLGEFEQGLPVAEELKKIYPTHFLLITFFSPSGYSVQKNHPVANYVAYLPMDSKKNASQFIQIVQPKLAIFIKYEFWHYYLAALHAKKIPTLLVSAIFRKEQIFFKWHGQFYKKILSCFSYFFVQDEVSKTLLASIGFNKKIAVTGDTRFDRVIAIANQFNKNSTIEQFCANDQIIIAGSTWSEDDKALHHFAIANKNIKFIIAPHDIEKERLDECLQFYPDAILYSNYQDAATENSNKSYRTLVIDNMGMLSSLYHYATIAFIGGGFTDEGVHNTLEAAVYGVPVVFGPVYDKYLEAINLIDVGGAFTAFDLIELETIFKNLLIDEQNLKSAGAAALAFVTNQSGATKKILDYIQENRLLIN